MPNRTQDNLENMHTAFEVKLTSDFICMPIHSLPGVYIVSNKWIKNISSSTNTQHNILTQIINKQNSPSNKLTASSFGVLLRLLSNTLFVADGQPYCESFWKHYQECFALMKEVFFFYFSYGIKHMTNIWLAAF